MRKYRRLMLIGLGLGLFVVIVLMLLSDVEQLLHYALGFPWWVMIPALALRAVNWALRFVKWHFYLRLVGVRDLSAPDSAAVFLTGFPLAISPGKAAEILKSFILFTMTGAPVMATLPVVAAERFSDGLAVLLLIALAIVNLAAHEYWPIVLICLGLLGGGIVLLQIRPLCLAALRGLSRLPLVGRFTHSFELFYESSYRIVLLPNLIVASGLGFVANFLDGVGVYLILVGLGLPATAETFYQALLVISLSVVAGSLSGMPGAIGAADLTITGTLQKLVGLSVPQAGFATLLTRFVQLWFGVLVGGLVAFVFRRKLFPESLESVMQAHEAAQQTPVRERAVSLGD
ncbi:MAG: flippase-like domain-containing protein [Anaerolineae bacterium]|nr:flippase-like domain-containing protein [Anaerolineae bacterium]